MNQDDKQENYAITSQQKWTTDKKKYIAKGWPFRPIFTKHKIKNHTKNTRNEKREKRRKKKRRTNKNYWLHSNHFHLCAQKLISFGGFFCCLFLGSSFKIGQNHWFVIISMRRQNCSMESTEERKKNNMLSFGRNVWSGLVRKKTSKRTPRNNNGKSKYKVRKNFFFLGSFDSKWIVEYKNRCKIKSIFKRKKEKTKKEDWMNPSASLEFGSAYFESRYRPRNCISLI